MVFGSATAGGSGEAAGSVAKETSTANFTDDVINASRDALVIVDFYSTASPQSKQLSAVLEKAVAPHAASLRLVRMDVDKNPALVGQLRLQAVPTVYVFRDGRPVDGFAGPQPDEVVAQFVESLAGASATADVAAVVQQANEIMETGDLQTAAQMFASILQADTQNVPALAGLAQCYVKTGDFDRARQTIELVPPDQKKGSAIQSVLAALDLAEKAGDVSDTSEIEAKLSADPGNHQVRYDLALALAANGAKQEAVDHLIEIVAQEPAWNEEAARKQLLQFFEAWGAKDDATKDGRRRLASLLFR